MQVTSAWPLMEAWALFIFILGTLSLLRNHKQNVVEGPCLASPFEAVVFYFCPSIFSKIP